MAVGGKGARPADWPGARPRICGGRGGVWVWAWRAPARGVVAGFVCERVRRGASVARGSNALDSKALH